MTTVLFDSDSLIKLTKAHAKETIVNNFNAIIPSQIEQETTYNAKGKPDAVLIEQNIRLKKIKVIKPSTQHHATEQEIKELGLKGGEQDLYRLSTQHHYDLISSDDQKVLKTFQSLGKPAITPATVIVLLQKKNKISTIDATHLLKNLKPHINTIEYDLALQAIGGHHANNSQNH